MSGLSAVVFVPDDTGKTGYSRPMMLQAIMGTPLLSWLTRSLAAGGVGRFFLVCHERFLSEAKRCFPDGCELSCAKLEETADQLHVFLSTADEQEEDVIVVTGPAVSNFIRFGSSTVLPVWMQSSTSCIFASDLRR